MCLEKIAKNMSYSITFDRYKIYYIDKFSINFYIIKKSIIIMHENLTNKITNFCGKFCGRKC